MQRKPLPPPNFFVADERIDGDIGEMPLDALNQAIDRLPAIRSADVEKSGVRRGRPTTYDPGINEVVEALHMLGASVAAVCSICGIDPASYYDWCKRYPNFASSVMKGRELADARVAKSTYHRAIGYSHPEEKIYVDKDGNVTRVRTMKHYPPDTAAAIYWLNNRGKSKWRSAVDMSHHMPDGKPVDPTQPPAITINATPSPRRGD